MKFDVGSKAGKPRCRTSAGNRGDAKKRGTQHSPQRPKGPYLIFVCLFLVAAAVVFALDAKNLYDLWNFGGGVLSLASMPVAVVFLLILLFISKVVAVIYNRELRLISWLLVVLYLFLSLVTLGIGKYFPAMIEKVVNDRRQIAAAYARALRTWANETIDHAARFYRKPYVDEISRNIRWETEHGGCKARCRQDMALLEPVERNWEAYFESLNRPVQLVEDFKKSEFDQLQVKPSFSEAKAMAMEANRLNLELTEKVDQAVSKIVSARPKIVEYFSPNKVARKEKATTDAGNKANAGREAWPEWRPMDAATRDDLTINFAGQVDFWRAFKAGLETIYIPLVLLFLLLSQFIIEFLQTRRQLSALFSGGGIWDFTDHEFYNYAANEFPFDDDWNRFLDSPAGRTWRLSPSKAFAWRLRKYKGPQAAGTDPAFNLLKSVAAHLLSSPEADCHRDILKSLVKVKEVKSGQASVFLHARIAYIFGLRPFVSRFTRPRNPSTRRSWEELRTGVREQLKSFGGAVKVPCSKEIFLDSLENNVVPHKDAQRGKEIYYLYSPQQCPNKSIQIIENLVRYGIAPFDRFLAERLVQQHRNAREIVIHADIPVLLREKGILSRLASFEMNGKATTETRTDVFDDIMNALENTENRPDLEDLLGIDQRLNREDPNKLMTHARLALMLWNEIAREYTHRADNPGAESYLRKIQELRDGMKRKGYDTRFLINQLITAKVVTAHNRADLLDYEGALQIRTVMQRWASLKTDAIEKCRSALGHILAVSGHPEEGRKELKYAFEHISWSLSPQVGISLAMAWIADKKMKSLQEADAVLRQVEKRLEGKDFILDKNKQGAWVRLARVKLLFVRICRRKLGIFRKKLPVEELDGIKDACAFIRAEEEEQYFNQIALHLRNLASLAVCRDTVDNEDFYVTMADRIDKKVATGDEPINLVDCLRALMVTSYLWAMRAVAAESSVITLLEKHRKFWATTLGKRHEDDRDIYRRIRKYLLDIASVDLSGDRKVVSNALCGLLAKAEYIPAILPTNLLG